jgi:hypothetical protein
MPIARVVNGELVERRAGDITSIAAHKVAALGWKTLIEQGSGSVESIAIDGDTVTITKSNPLPTSADVKAEAQRRIIALTGTADLTQCIVKQLNANMRANELNDIRHDREWTTEEAAEAAALRALATAIKAVRAKSNDLESMSPIPSDYTSNSYW